MRVPKIPLKPSTGTEGCKHRPTTFDALAAKCVEPKKKRSLGKDWISKGTWKLIVKCTSLLRRRKIRQAAARRMKRKVQAALKADKSLEAPCSIHGRSIIFSMYYCDTLCKQVDPSTFSQFLIVPQTDGQE